MSGQYIDNSVYNMSGFIDKTRDEYNIEYFSVYTYHEAYKCIMYHKSTFTHVFTKK